MKYIHTVFTFCLSFAFFTALSQNPFPDLPPVFKDEVVGRVDILLPPDSLAILLAPGNEESNYHWHATFVFHNGEISDTIGNIGFRLRGNTSRQSAKKSFKVSFNTYEPGRSWYGLEKLNLNGEHNDPTIARSKISWDLMRWAGVPAPRSSYVELYINGEYRGIYIHVEHIDEEFAGLRFGNKDGNLYKCLWPADLHYKGNDPDAYKEMFGSRRAYQLQTNEEADDYTDLAHFIDVLNNTPLAGLPCELEQVFNVDTYLKTIAADILTANWDGPIFNKNNFYLYHNQATGQFEYIPYDLDNTFGIDWFQQNWAERDIYNWQHQSEYRPIYERIMAVPEYRDRFSFYMNEYLNGFYQESFLFPYLDNLKTLISPSAQADVYRTFDYGFTFGDFENAYEEALPFFHTPIGLKEFITKRHNSASLQLELNDISPIITALENNYPGEMEDIAITARAQDDGTVASMEVCYQVNGQNLTCTAMYDDGLHGDGAAADGVFGAVIPALGQAAFVEYYVHAADNASQESRQPVCGFRHIFIGESSTPLVINEFMASNSSTYADEAGEFDDWIEIHNLGDVPLFLGNRFLSDNPDNPAKWQVPDIWIQPDGYVVVWADEDQSQGLLHANFKLSAGGEYIGLYEGIADNLALIDGYTFGEQQTDISFGRLPNGTGPFQPVNATPGYENAPYSDVLEDGPPGIGMAVFPNPFSETFNVVLDGEMPGPGELALVNALGVEVLRQAFTNQQLSEISAGGLSPGLYFLVVKKQDGERIAGRVLVKE
ncbi:MAG: CotH kinase family protein [Lewinellaceae bacterium]|nr:CotH kinase family protein [Saprospiraceae bacterium]MCB9338918.1 CotH kinase family protein [Lewinellaceae bacterium]